VARIGTSFDKAVAGNIVRRCGIRIIAEREVLRRFVRSLPTQPPE
jgi:hypothetical protein